MEFPGRQVASFYGDPSIAARTPECSLQVGKLEVFRSKRCYGIVGDALNPVVDALRRNGKIDSNEMKESSDPHAWR